MIAVKVPVNWKDERSNRRSLGRSSGMISGCILPGTVAWQAQCKILVSMSIPWTLEGLLCIETVTLVWSGLDAARQIWLAFWLSMTFGKGSYTLDCKPNLRNIPKSLWRGTEWSGGLVVLKRSFTVSLRLLDVLSGFWGGVVFWFGWFCFCFRSCF